MDLAGVILDIYDDPKGLVLRQKLASAKKLPEKLASAQLCTTEELGALPDRLFALVAQNHGETIRKYAMHDEPHLATSIIYFGACGHLLPEDAQQKIAQNLATACSWYDQDPPEFLVKRALLNAIVNGLTVASAVPQARQAVREGSSRGAQRLATLRGIQGGGL